MFLGEILGATIVAADHKLLNPLGQIKQIKVSAKGVESEDGELIMDKTGKLVKIVENVDSSAHYDLFARQLGYSKQSAVIGSFDEQAKMWSKQPTLT